VKQIKKSKIAKRKITKKLFEDVVSDTIQCHEMFSSGSVVLFVYLQVLNINDLPGYREYEFI